MNYLENWYLKTGKIEKVNWMQKHTMKLYVHDEIVCT